MKKTYRKPFIQAIALHGGEAMLAGSAQGTVDNNSWDDEGTETM